MKNILIPIDLSSVTNSTVEVAAHFAQGFGAKIWLVHVAAPDPDFVGFGTGPRYVRDQRADELSGGQAAVQPATAHRPSKLPP